MDVFLARQPIFDLKGNVYGYEILYRESEVNCFNESDQDYASGNALSRAFFDFGISEFTNNRKAFVNFTGEFLKNNIATIFPRDYLVVEILENVLIDDEIIRNCKTLKSLGYAIAIDDFCYQTGYDELIKLVDLIKIDFKTTPEAERTGIINKFRRSGLSFLAEKVETREDYHYAVRMGFSYFQGYFFARPEVGRKKKFIPYKENRLKLITTLNSEKLEFDDITRLIEGDLAFSYEILRLVNSAYFGRISEIKSIRFALLLLGIDEIKKWLYLAFISDLMQDEPEEIINISMLRGKFLENLAICAKHPELSSEMLTIGMFSTIHLLLDKPIMEILDEMHFSDNIKLVLSGEEMSGFSAQCYRAVLKYEQGEWDAAFSAVKDSGITATVLRQAYLDSIRWIKTLKMR